MSMRIRLFVAMVLTFSGIFFISATTEWRPPEPFYSFAPALLLWMTAILAAAAFVFAFIWVVILRRSL